MDIWLAENCHLISANEDYEGAVANYLKFKEQFRGLAGNEFLRKCWRLDFHVCWASGKISSSFFCDVVAISLDVVTIAQPIFC